MVGQSKRTRRKRLLELLGLVGVLKDKGVDEALASDLELDVAGLLVLLYARSCIMRQQLSSVSFPTCYPSNAVRCPLIVVHSLARSATSCGRNVEHTPGILAAADLDELLDIGDFGRHFGGLWWIEVGDLVVRLGS